MSTSEFGLLIDREHDFLSQLAMKLTKRRDDADDLLQDTYYKALKNKDKFATGTNLKGWLYTIMKNTFINNYRRKKQQNTFVDETEGQFFLNLYLLGWKILSFAKLLCLPFLFPLCLLGIINFYNFLFFHCLLVLQSNLLLNQIFLL